MYVFLLSFLYTCLPLPAFSHAERGCICCAVVGSQKFRSAQRDLQHLAHLFGDCFGASFCASCHRHLSWALSEINVSATVLVTCCMNTFKRRQMHLRLSMRFLKYGRNTIARSKLLRSCIPKNTIVLCFLHNGSFFSLSPTDRLAFSKAERGCICFVVVASQQVPSAPRDL
jgi:hypothetical protein